MVTCTATNAVTPSNAKMCRELWSARESVHEYGRVQYKNFEFGKWKVTMQQKYMDKT